MINSKAAAARRLSPLLMLFSIGAILALIFAIDFVEKNYPVPPIQGFCDGYGGLPTYDFLGKNADKSTAFRYCHDGIPDLVISVKNRDYIKLQEKRAIALKEKVLNTTDDDFVPAHFLFAGQTRKGRLRLKGDWIDHLDTPKSWSLRIALQGEDEILSRHVFSLQKLEVRDYDIDPVYMTMLRQADIMAVGSKLVHVIFNEQDWGLMAIEDHFTTELMESERRKETMIGRFDESPMWVHRAINPDFGPYDNVYVNTYEPFSDKKIQKSKSLSMYNTIAVSLMTAWQEGRIPLEQIIDRERYADFILITEAWGSYHPLRWHNLRFYFNPYTYKFEPVAFDNSLPLESIVNTYSYVTGPYLAPLSELFHSQAFDALIASRAVHVKEQLVDGPAFNRVETEAAYYKKALQQYSLPSHVDLNVLKNNFDYLTKVKSDYFVKHKNIWNPSSAPSGRQYQTMVKVSRYEDGCIALNNKMPFEILVTAIRAASKNGNRVATVNVKLPITLPPTGLGKRPQTILVGTDIKTGEGVVEVEAVNPRTSQHVVDITKQKLIFIDESNLKDYAPMEQDREVNPNFIVRNGSQWAIPAGTWHFDKPLIVPVGVTLTVTAGADLSFAAKAYLLSYGALNFQGEADKKIALHGEGNAFWGGIDLLGGAIPSHWEHVTFSNINAFSMKNFELTGALNTYRAQLSLLDVGIEHAQSEDAINFVNSKIDVTNMHIFDTHSDGIDSDFSEGQVRNSYFSHIGGDALDVSGTKLYLSDLSIDNVHDKGLSIGEASDMVADNIRISNAGTGVASKDYSRIVINHVSVDHALVGGLMAYCKKSVYGGASITATDVHVGHSANPIIAQFGSVITVDGRKIKGTDLDVRELYKEGPMRK